MNMTIRHMIALCLMVLVCSISTSHADGVPDILGASADVSTPPAIPITSCGTLGYNIDGTLTFSLISADVAVQNFNRVEKFNRVGRTGYFLTRNNTNSTELIVYSYDAVAMTLINTTIVQVVNQLDYGVQRVGDIFQNDLYLVRNINGGRLGCGVGKVCMSITKIQSNGTVTPGPTVDISGIVINSLDDIYIDSGGIAYVIFSDGANRRMAIFNAPAQTFIGNGPSLGVGAQGVFAYQRTVTDAIYVGFLDGSRTVKKFATGSTTPSATSTYSFSGSNTLQGLSAAVPLNFLLGGSSSFGGIASNIGYKNFDLVTSLSSVSYASTDGSVSRGAAYYDETNNKLHVMMTDVGAGAFNFIRSTVNPFTIEQRFNCATPVQCGSAQFRLYDYAEVIARFYVGSGSLGVGTIQRVKVCATGGPAAT